MKAIRFHEFGSADVLRYEDVEDPTPGPGQVVVRVGAAALNHLDVDVREGISRFPIGLPHGLGIEFAGEVESVGSGVTDVKAGDRVAPYVMDTCGTCRYCRTGRESLCLAPGFVSFSTGGAFAEKVCVSAKTLLRVPDNVSFEDAAAIQVAFGTAWHMLFTRARLAAGEAVMVNAVGSGIGSAAVQLASTAGAFVIGNASSQEKLDRAAELGMDVGINRLTENIAERVMEVTDGIGVDVVFEHVGGDIFQASLDSLTKDGRLVTCGGHAGEVVPFDIIPFFRTQKQVIGSFVYNQDEAQKCFDWVGRGLVKPLVHSSYPLADTAEAMREMERREQFGKIVLVP